MSFIPSGLIRFFSFSVVATWLYASGAHADIYNDAGRAVVRLTVEGTLKLADAKGSVDYYDVGTGFLVSPDGLILTAGHLFPPLNSFKDGQMWIRVALTVQQHRRMGATTPTRAARLLKLSQYPGDVAILKIDPDEKPFPYLRLCDDYDASTRTIMLGYGAGDTYIRKLEGYVEAPDNGVDPADLQLPTSPGDSGAPVFNETGGVFALVIGNPIVNGIPVSGSAAAVTIPVTINTLSPETTVLSGLSYFPKCDQKPPPLSKTVLYPVSASAPGRIERTFNIAPPAGYEFTGKVDLTKIFGANTASAVVVPKNLSSNSIDLSVFAEPNQPPGIGGGQLGNPNLSTNKPYLTPGMGEGILASPNLSVAELSQTPGVSAGKLGSPNLTLNKPNRTPGMGGGILAIPNLSVDELSQAPGVSAGKLGSPNLTLNKPYLTPGFDGGKLGSPSLSLTPNPEVFGNIAAEVKRKIPPPTSVNDSPGDEVSGLTLELRKEDANAHDGKIVYSVTSQPPIGMMFDDLLKIEFIQQNFGGNKRPVENNKLPIVTVRDVKPNRLFISASLSSDNGTAEPDSFTAVATLQIVPVLWATTPP